MLAKLYSVAITGIDAEIVEVELDLTGGLVGIRIVGMPDNAVKEAADRVKSALKNSGYEYPQRKMVINLAPAELKKEGAVYDLPIALSILFASEQVQCARPPQYLVLGELALDGSVRPVRGVLAAAITAKQKGFKAILVPKENAAEAGALSEQIKIVPVSNLKQAAEYLAGEAQAEAIPEATADETFDLPLCYSDVRGQEHVKRAFEVAAAGGHHVLVIGPPGTGKSMSAQRLPTILPELSYEESLEVTKIYSVAGELIPGQGLVRRRPFRSPHHSASAAGLIGGGANPRPGELSLAHNGVLFLDEAPEFPRNILETLRQPLEDGVITISRAAQSVKYPSNIMLILSCNMCPCGKRGDSRKTCRCTPQMIERYMSRLSGPLLDRVDLHVEAPMVKYQELRGPRTGETSATIRERVTDARKRQYARFAGSSTPTNARMNTGDLEKHCALSQDCEMLLKAAVDELGLSARACTRVLKVARTIADLAGAEKIGIEYLSEAIQYRVLDRKSTY